MKRWLLGEPQRYTVIVGALFFVLLMSSPKCWITSFAKVICYMGLT